MSEFGRFLREARIAAGLTQYDVADALGVRQSRISNIELGRDPPPLQAGIVTRLAEAVGCKVDDLCAAAGVLPPDLQARVGEVIEIVRGHEGQG